MEPRSKSPLGLSTSQAAQALGVSLGTIRRWSDMGYLESYRTPGGQRRFSQEQIDKFVGSLEQQGPDPERHNERVHAKANYDECIQYSNTQGEEKHSRDDQPDGPSCLHVKNAD